MIRWDIERVEVMVFVLDFRAVQYGKAQRNEQIFDLGLESCDGVYIPLGGAGRGQGQIDPLGIQARGSFLFVELALPLF